MPLEPAVALLGRMLKMQLDPPKPEARPTFAQQLSDQLSQPKPAGEPATKLVLYDPIIFVQSGQQLKANRNIISILGRELGRGYEIFELNEARLSSATYVLTGAITQHPSVGRVSQPGYDLVISVLEVGKWRVVAKGQVWVDTLPFEAFAIYEDSPIYLLDKSSRMAKESSSWAIGQQVDPSYIGFLATKGKLQDAISFYEAKKYTDSVDLFNKIIGQPQGRTLTALGGLYLSLQKLGRESEAEQAFSQLLSVAIEENHRLDIKLLFGVNSPTFVANKELAKLYAWWLRLIATHMEKSNLCLKVVGHCSHTGDEVYNDRLSLARAKTVLRVMAATYHGILKKSMAVGKGFRENIVGTGADDASDALDRRVEFAVINCEEIAK